MNFYNYLKGLPKVNEILKSNKISISRTCDDYNYALIACDFYENNKSLFIVLPTVTEAQKYYDALNNYCNEEDVLFYPADELITESMISSSGDFLFERIQTISTLLEGKKKIVIMNFHASIKLQMSKEKWASSILNLKPSMLLNIKDLVSNLIKMGYENVYTTVKTGQFSKRGSIVDIFPLGYDFPVRIDFFDDEIDTIKTYNPETQRSIGKIDSINVIPVAEFLFSDTEYNIAKNKILSFMELQNLSQIEEDLYKGDLENLYLHKSLETLNRYLTFFETEPSTIFDFIDDKRIYQIDPIKSLEAYDRLSLDVIDYCKRIGGYSISKLSLYANFNKILDNTNVQIEGIRSLLNVDLEINASDSPIYQSKVKAIKEDLLGFKNKRLLIVSITNLERLDKLNELILENNYYLSIINDLSELKKGNINVIKQNLPAFECNDLIILNEASIFEIKKTLKKAKYKSVYKNAQKISRYDELVIGDYVVHYDHGIGRYKGIQTLTRNNIDRDYLYIEYAGESSLYIPLEQISNIMKYASGDIEGIKLHAIGSSEWAKTKAKVRKKVNDISGKLIALYAARKNAVGFAFPQDGEYQQNFEADFPYELTKDQKKAVDDVKNDMEKTQPMDRLICGDVGYGKTEVAMRAVFKAVYGGKQCAVLAPTTILARQHYMTFKTRMENYGVKVELLNRFVPKKKQTEIIEGLKEGSVDVIVGTHRLLSNEIKYKDLGLLVIDEEQRFGVTHKERIKELKVNIDCITLSATPIPRTLQMSVMGIKDLSMIETPPKNRYPIQTYVIERNDKIIKDAIEREIARGGQVFYLYNFVDTIMDVKDHLQTLLPSAKIGVGHGKLTKDQLENVIIDFVDKKYDILLCTTIIETGIDMPDTNTLIIHDADRLGLSQMYQIRGRVGRSNKIAYAYLMYEPRKLLTPQAEKRLQTIKEFNELGSGFKIAMRDLSIRGSGDILGDEQSGFVESVGLDIYLKILDEEINKKPTVVKKTDASILEPLTSRTISKNYIDNDDMRIELHKKIDLIDSLEKLEELNQELVDRFGEVDKDILCYMYEKLMKSYCKQLDIYKIDKKNKNNLIFIFTEEKSKKLDGRILFSKVNEFKNITLTYLNSEIRIVLNILGTKKLDYFKEICLYFSKIL